MQSGVTINKLYILKLLTLLIFVVFFEYLQIFSNRWSYMKYPLSFKLLLMAPFITNIITLKGMKFRVANILIYTGLLITISKYEIISNEINLDLAMYAKYILYFMGFLLFYIARDPDYRFNYDFRLSGKMAILLLISFILVFIMGFIIMFIITV